MHPLMVLWSDTVMRVLRIMPNESEEIVPGFNICKSSALSQLRFARRLSLYNVGREYETSLVD